MENKEISQQLRILKSQPLSQSSCANIIEILKMKLKIFKAKKDAIAAGIFNNATIRNIEKEIAIYLEVLEVLEKNGVEICRL